jgi:cobalamin 5'-phosphate synthase/cobalamin synthase
MAGAVAWYPVVGFLVGLILCGAMRGSDALWPAPVSAALVVAAWVVTTGALHLDGVADVADAAFAPVTQSRRRQILRDVHHGTFAIAAVVLTVVLKLSLLTSFAGRAGSALVLAAPVAGRAAVLPAMRWFPPVSEKGFGSAARRGATLPALATAVVTVFLAAVAAVGWPGAVGVAVAFTSGLAVAGILYRRFGGLNGDCYGAVIESAEVAWLLSTSAFLAAGHVEIFPLWNGW